MAELVLVTGGSRSGKSAFALEKCQELPGRKCFIATCPVTDKEMEERIFAHREERLGLGWHTIEEQTNLVGTLQTLEKYDVVLIDCLTLWINNLMYLAENEQIVFGDAEMKEEAQKLATAAAQFKGYICCVTNEVGLGIVPDNPLARRYRDLTGRCNTIIAGHADEVYLVSCGIPLPLKSLTRK